MTETISTNLQWPIEVANRTHSRTHAWHHPGSNYCLDFHGDPACAELVIYSDGNHHMALEACCQKFLEENEQLTDIFYATTPPGVLVNALASGGLLMGNMNITVTPDVFISPENIMQQLQRQEFIQCYQGFARSVGNILLVKKGNPKKIHGIKDLLNADIRFFISSHDKETASFQIYADSIRRLAAKHAIDSLAIEQLLSPDSNTTVFGQAIHHREVPQALFEGRADVAMVYYHLGLRYTRIFPECFDMVPLDISSVDDDGNELNLTTVYNIGVVNSGRDWGQKFFDFMLSDTAKALYKKHGLTGV